MKHKPRNNGTTYLLPPKNANDKKIKKLKRLNSELLLLFKLKNIRKKIACLSIILLSSWLISDSLLSDTESKKTKSYSSKSLQIIIGVSTSALVGTYLLEEYIGSKNNVNKFDKTKF